MARVNSIDHVQLAMPPGAEDLVREFYAGVLGLTEVPKPPELAKRGGAWFEGPSIKLHLGVEQEFRPARKAHVGFVVDDVADLVDLCRAQNLETTDINEIDGYRRAHVFDPLGNRLEFMEPM